MRSCTARALLALVLLAVALEAIPTEQQTTVLQPLTLTATLNIEPGDALAPHIYDWYFDGVDDRVVVPYSPSYKVLGSGTWIAWVHLPYLKPSGWGNVFRDALYPYRRAEIQLYYTYRQFIAGFELAWLYAPVGSMNAYVGKWFMLTYRRITEAGVHSLIVDDFKASWSGSFTPGTLAPDSTYGLHIAYNHPVMYLSTLMIYSRALSDSEIAQAYNNNVVSASGLVLYLDATFYDGTRYIDLSGKGNHGVGYGGVSRVLSSRPGLYLVKGLHGDGLVHFRFFPVNTVVDVYNATTNSLVASFTVDGPANPAGLVEDYAVSLGPGSYRLAVYTTVYVQVAQPALPAFKLVVAHFKAELGPGCRVYIDYTAWPKAEPRTECGLQTDAVFLTGLPAGATVRVWNETVLYEVTASSTGVAVLGDLKPGAYEVKVYSDTLQIPHDHLLRLDPLSGLRQFFGFWDRLTFTLFTPVFVVGLVLAVYLRTWSAVLTALVALAAHIVIAPDNIWIRGLLALALAVAVYIAVWRRTTLI
jgi:hypothetical protein